MRMRSKGRDGALFSSCQTMTVYFLYEYWIVLAMPVDASPCPKDKILNVKTGKCVLIDGNVGKQLIQEHEAQKITLRPDDVEKIRKLLDKTPLKKPEVTKSKCPKVEKATVVPVQVSDALKERVQKALQKARGRIADRYHDEKHRDFCKIKTQKKRHLADLHTPHVKKTFEVVIPYYRLVISQHDFFYRMNGADDMALQFEKHREGINMKFVTDSHNETWRLAGEIGNRGAKTYDVMIEQTMDLDWLGEQQKYILGLPFRELYTVLGYTFVGDVMVNNYHRGKLTLEGIKRSFSDPLFRKYQRFHPLFYAWMDELRTCSYNPFREGAENEEVTFPHATKKTPQQVLDMLRSSPKYKPAEWYGYLLGMGEYHHLAFWKRVIKRYSKELQGVIQRAPRVKKTIVVYRGVKNDYYLQGTDGHYYVNKGFVSTSLNIKQAMKFAERGLKNTCCLKKITLLPGTKALFLMGISQFAGEMEVLLGHDTTYLVRKKKQLKHYVDQDDNKYCYDDVPKNPVYCSDIVVVK
jgi:hypothetical protein